MFGRLLAAAAFVATVSAQLTITNPNAASWWVQGSVNTLEWTCDTSPYSAYTVVVSNSDSSVLTAPLALIANVPNYDCSLSVNAQQSSLAASTSWTISFANIQNQSDIYASSAFTIKPAGSAYPTPAASAGPSGTNTSSPATSTSANKSGAIANYIPVGVSMAAAIVLGLVVG